MEPAGAPTPTQPSGGAFLQFNCNGVQHCRTELASFMCSRNIQVACLQESKLSTYSPYSDFPNYYSHRRDRSDGREGGGLLSLIHHSLTWTDFPTDHLFPGDSIIEHQGFTLIVDDAKLNIINIYIPPASKCPSGYRPNLDLLLGDHDEDTLIVGTSLPIILPGSPKQRIARQTLLEQP